MVFWDLPPDPSSSRPKRKRGRPTAKKSPARKVTAKKKRTKKKRAKKAPRTRAKKKSPTRWKTEEVMVDDQPLKVNVLYPKGWLGVGECEPADLGFKVICLFHMPSGGRLAALRKGRGQRQLARSLAEEVEGLTNWDSERVLRAAELAKAGDPPPAWFMELGRQILGAHKRISGGK